MQKLPKFVALSLIAHLLVASSVRVEPPQRDAQPQPLQARLQPAELPVTPPPAAAAPPARTTPDRKPRITEKPPPPAILAAPAFEPETVVPAAPHAEHDDGRPAAQRGADAEPPAVPSWPTETPVAADGTPAPAEPLQPAARRLPRKGEITYEVYLGTQKFSVGQTMQAWELNDDSYRLTSVSETTGVVSFFRRERRAYESVGKLTPSGLRPEFFANQRVRSGRSEDAKASFDWDAMKVTLGRAQEQKSVALPADAQDLISFMYQLGLRPLPTGRIEVPITNGWKLERYQLDIGPEEVLETPFGTLRALPVRQVRRPGHESIELWLATEYRLLPVKIQFFDRQGDRSGEQLVSDIRVSAD